MSLHKDIKKLRLRKYKLSLIESTITSRGWMLDSTPFEQLCLESTINKKCTFIERKRRERRLSGPERVFLLNFTVAGACSKPSPPIEHEIFREIYKAIKNSQPFFQWISAQTHFASEWIQKGQGSTCVHPYTQSVGHVVFKCCGFVMRRTVSLRRVAIRLQLYAVVPLLSRPQHGQRRWLVDLCVSIGTHGSSIWSHE